MVVVKDELCSLGKDVAKGLPHHRRADSREPTEPMRKKPPLWSVILGVLFVVLFVVAVIAYPFVANSCSLQPLADPARAPDLQPLADPARAPDLQARLAKLATRWHCTEKDVLESLLRATRWDERHAPEAFTIDKAGSDSKILEIVSRLEKDNVVFDNPSSDFARFIEGAVREGAVRQPRAIDCRKWLRSSANMLLHLKEKAEKAGDAWEKPDEVRKLLTELAKLSVDDLGRVDPHEPKTPVFDRGDELHFDMLMKFFGLAKGSLPFKAAPEGLADFCEKLMSKDIMEAIDKSRKNAVDAVANKDDGEGAVHMASTYKELQRLVNELAGEPFGPAGASASPTRKPSEPRSASPPETQLFPQLQK
jgi:hypothetical protein